jgi:hypothetical protein
LLVSFFFRFFFFLLSFPSCTTSPSRSPRPRVPSALASAADDGGVGGGVGGGGGGGGGVEGGGPLASAADGGGCGAVGDGCLSAFSFPLFSVFVSTLFWSVSVFANRPDKALFRMSVRTPVSLLRQHLYFFCTSKASKLSTLIALSVDRLVVYVVRELLQILD